MWLCFRDFMATLTAPGWKRTSSSHRLWPATSEFRPWTLCKILLCEWSCWAVISTVSCTNVELNLTFRVIAWRRWGCLFVRPCVSSGCSLPLGLQRKQIPDSSLSASSFHSSLLRSWSPSLARLHQEGSANAWRPKVNAYTYTHVVFICWNTFVPGYRTRWEHFDLLFLVDQSVDS